MKRVNMKKGKMLVLATLLFFGLAGLAEAQLVMGRVTAQAGGFPSFVRDADRTPVLAICLDGPAFCEPTPVIVGNPQSERTTFGGLAPYFRITARVQTTAPTRPRVLVEMSVNATYAGAIANGNQMVTNTLFVDLAGMPVDGAYIVRHPWGQRTVQVLGGRARRAFTGKGRAADGFQNAASGPVKSFLTAANPPPPADGQHIGVLFRTQTLTGGPSRNFVEVEAPAGADLGGRAQPNILRITQFTVEGKVF